MKKLLFPLLFLFLLVIASNAQVLKTDFLSGYSVGDSIETNVYTVADITVEPLVLTSWSRAISDNVGPNVVAVVPLTYPDYVNSAQGVGALMLDSIGTRSTIFSLPVLATGTYYLAALIKPTQFASTTPTVDFLSFDIDGKGATLRARVAIKRGQEIGKVIFGLNKKNSAADIVWGTTEYDVNSTNLVVLKVTVGSTPVSLYINPTKSSTEPTTADITTNLTDNLLSIKGIAMRRSNRGYDGVISGIVLTDNWNDLWQVSASSVEIPSSNKEIESVRYYTLNGLEMNSDKPFSDLENGIYIQKTKYKDGITKTIKVVKNR